LRLAVLAIEEPHGQLTLFKALNFIPCGTCYELSSGLERWKGSSYLPFRAADI